MNGLALAALLVWIVLCGASLRAWVPPAPTNRRPFLGRVSGLVTVVLVAMLGTGAVAVLAAFAPPLRGPWHWLSFGIALVAALLTGGPVTSCLLAIADQASREQGPRVHRTILRGGAWIGAVERVAMAASILTGWTTGIAVIIAVKGLGRYPEIKSGQGTGVAERFILGTFVSLGWAAACAGIALLLV